MCEATITLLHNHLNNLSHLSPTSWQVSFWLDILLVELPEFFRSQDCDKTIGTKSGENWNSADTAPTTTEAKEIITGNTMNFFQCRYAAIFLEHWNLQKVPSGIRSMPATSTSAWHTWPCSTTRAEQHTV